MALLERLDGSTGFDSGAGEANLNRPPEVHVQGARLVESEPGAYAVEDRPDALKPSAPQHRQQFADPEQTEQYISEHMMMANEVRRAKEREEALGTAGNSELAERLGRQARYLYARAEAARRTDRSGRAVGTAYVPEFPNRSRTVRRGPPPIPDSRSWIGNSSRKTERRAA